MISTAVRAGVISFVVIEASAIFPVASMTPGRGAVASVPMDLPGRNLPVVREHTYRMAGKVRLVVFWVARDNVGEGTIKWRAAGGEKAYELLIGSDPQLAPGQLNKWGYLVEHLHGSESEVVGLISQDNEHRLSDVKAGLENPENYRAFDTIRGHVVQREAWARVGTLYAESRFTSREAPTVLAGMLADSSLDVKHLERPAGVRGGFLSSLTELIQDSIKSRQNGPLRYVHGNRLFELRLLESKALDRFERDGRSFEKVVRSRFETAEVGDRSGTRFELVYGTSGALTGIPILISYQPKWWLHVDLVLQT